MRAAVVLCIAVLAVSASAYREYARNGAGALHAAGAGADPTAAERANIVAHKSMCPFVGSAVNEQKIRVIHGPAGTYASQPLSFVEDVVRVGNSGAGSTLGFVLKVFSTGNHAKMLNEKTGKLDLDVPAGTFALDFPGSQGAHWGHSGVLMGNPHTVNSGHWSAADWARLLAISTSGPSKGALLTTADIGHFIAENIKRDPNAKSISGGSLLRTLFADSLTLFGDVGTAALKLFRNPNALTASEGEWRTVIAGITKLAGDDNLIGSAGEFGLLLAFLEHSPVAQQNSGNAFAVADIQRMFQQKLFPVGWEQWKKSAVSWVTYSSQLTWHARKRLNELNKQH